MQTMTFNQAQREVLDVISCLQTDQEIAKLKATLVKFMNDRLQVELDKLWDEGVLSDEKLASYRNEHFRTSY